MTDDEKRARVRAYHREYARKRRALDPEFQDRTRKNNRASYHRRMEDPEFAARRQEYVRLANAARQARRKALGAVPRRGSLPGFDETIGGIARARRRARRMSLSDAARALGVSHGQLAKYERGETVITSGTLYQMSALYGVPIDRFFPGPHPAAPTAPALPSQETRDLVRLFLAIADPIVRGRLLDLTMRLAETHPSPDAEGVA